MDVLFSGTNTSTEYWFAYDGAGNMTSKVTETPTSGGTIVTETRTYNTLNQLISNSIQTVVTSPPSTTTVLWTYAYDLSCNLLYKTTSTGGFAYTWAMNGAGFPWPRFGSNPTRP